MRHVIAIEPAFDPTKINVFCRTCADVWVNCDPKVGAIFSEVHKAFTETKDKESNTTGATDA